MAPRYTGLELLKDCDEGVLEAGLDRKGKIKIVDRIATVEFRLVEGSDDEIQIEGLIALLCSLK